MSRSTPSTPSTPPVFIGIDVGCLHFSAAVAGRRPRDFDHSPAGVAALLRWVGRPAAGELRAVCESSGPYSLKLAGLLRARGVGCAIVPPQRVRANAKALGQHSKTDQLDARVILDFAMHVQPPAQTPPPPAEARLAALLQARETLKADTRRWSNRLHALTQLPDSPAEVLALPVRLLAQLEAELQTLNAAVDALVAAEPELARQAKLLLSIPGIGRETCLALLARVEILRTRDPKTLTAYAGLAPRHRQSGSSLRGHSLIGRSSDPQLRQLLYMGSLTAARYSPALAALYQRLRAEGKHSKLAHCAVARKLLLIAQAILISGKPFDPQHNPKEA